MGKHSLFSALRGKSFMEISLELSLCVPPPIFALRISWTLHLHIGPHYMECTLYVARCHGTYTSNYATSWSVHQESHTIFLRHTSALHGWQLSLIAVPVEWFPMRFNGRLSSHGRTDIQERCKGGALLDTWTHFYIRRVWKSGSGVFLWLPFLHSL